MNGRSYIITLNDTRYERVTSAFCVCVRACARARDEDTRTIRDVFSDRRRMYVPRRAFRVPTRYLLRFRLLKCIHKGLARYS